MAEKWGFEKMTLGGTGGPSLSAIAVFRADYLFAARHLAAGPGFLRRLGSRVALTGKQGRRWWSGFRCPKTGRLRHRWSERTRKRTPVPVGDRRTRWDLQSAANPFWSRDHPLRATV